MRHAFTWILLACVTLALPLRAAETATQPADVTATQTAAGAVDEAEGATPIVPAGSTIEALIFYIVGGAAAICALGCVLSMNIVRMATFLFGTLGSVAVLYFAMAANFIGAIQLIVYAGGTLIVIIFGVMLTSKSPWVKFAPKPLELIAGAGVCLALFIGLVTALVRTNWPQARSAAEGFSVERIGRELLTTYLVPFELASVLLLAVMIGAAYLARAERR